MFDDVLDLEVESDNEMEIDNPTSVIIRGRWSLDGAQSLADAVEMAREQAEYFEQLIDMGYELEGVIDDDYGVARLA